MAIKSNEDLMNGIKSILGDRTDEAALGLLEDMDDTLKDYATNANIDWKNKYEENDAAWKQKYRDRFFGTVVDEDDKPNVVPPAMPKISINDNGEELRVDEKLQRTLSKDLHKAFSLNDRYRFRRELFSNSELDWNDALNMVASMSSYEEAEDYFYNDLGWDKNSEEVADFMNVIKNHFS